MTEQRLRTTFRPRDLAELAIGATVMGGPFVVSEEVWNLSEELRIGRVLLIAVATFVTTAAMLWMILYHAEPPEDRRHFVRRVFIAYGLALVVAALMLFAVDRLPLFTEPIIALKRTILVALPASFAATGADSLMDRQG